MSRKRRRVVRWEGWKRGRGRGGGGWGSGLEKWERWEDSEVARSEKWEGSEVATWER